jgi:hypothetical protein
MSLVQYTISNNSSVGKTFTYNSSSVTYNIFVPGFTSSIFLGDDTPPPALLITGSMVSEDTFVSDAYIPPSGSAWLWSNGNKVQYIKISNTPLTGSNIGSAINQAEWIEFSMVEAVDKDNNYLYPTSPNSARVERYVIDNASDRGAYNSIIINDSSPETSTAVFANTTSTETGFSYIDSQFSIDQDCDPILNNAVDPRLNEWLQDVDYSVNATTPINFNQLINFTATKAAVPQSNYTQLGFVHSRYAGSSTTRIQINEFNALSTIDNQNKLAYSDGPAAFLVDKGKGPTLGKIPNVELNNAYIAYFNKIIDPYPILNNKVAYYVKFLVDDAGNVLDPILSDINFSVFKDTFQLRDYDNKPTRVNTTISSIDESKELLQLNEGLASVFKMGKYPVPILYTQTSSIGNASEISLSGSKFYSIVGFGENVGFTDFGANIFATQSIFPSPTSATGNAVLPINNLTYQTSNIKFTNPSPGEWVYTTSSISNAPVLFPDDPFGTPLNTAGGTLSDDYVLNGTFKFTTSTIPARFSGNGLDEFKDRDVYYGGISTAATPLFVNLFPYQKPPASADNINNYALSTTNFEITAVRLTIITRPGESSEFTYKTLNLVQTPKLFGFADYGKQWELIPSFGLSFIPNSLYIEELILKTFYNAIATDKTARNTARVLIGGGWFYDTVSSTIKGIDNIDVRYDWEIDFKQSGFKQGSGFYLKAEGGFNIPQSTGRHGGLGGNKYADDVFIWYNAGGESGNDIQWRRTFSPNYNNKPGVNINTKPILKYSITSRFSANSNLQNLASGPFWRRLSGTTDMLYMSSSILNQTYGIPQPDGTYNPTFLQAKLDYVGDVSTDFPLTIEPGFIEFDPVSDVWSLEPGDEIRFENDETFVYTISSVEGREPITIPADVNSELPENKLKIVVTPPFEYTGSDGNIIKREPSNFDFFVVRRYKDNKNFIILNQQMPYGFSYGNGTIDYSGEDIQAGVEPVTRASSPGILLPEHRIEVFNKNPDLILKDLIEKGIVT